MGKYLPIERLNHMVSVHLVLWETDKFLNFAICLHNYVWEFQLLQILNTISNCQSL